MKTPPHWNGSTLLIEARKVKVVRGERVLVQSLDFSLEAGGCLLVYGENGAGKSTLLRMLAGFLPLENGHISMPFLPQEADEVTRFMHYIGHKDGHKEVLSAAENLRLWAHMMGGDTKQANQNHILEKVGLSRIADMPAGLLSAGQRRRLAFARLLVAQRPVWILDEPATALDVKGLAFINGLVAEHRAQGGGVVAATHTALEWPKHHSITLTRHAGSLLVQENAE